MGIFELFCQCANVGYVFLEIKISTFIFVQEYWISIYICFKLKIGFKTNGEVNSSPENTTVVVRIYDGINRKNNYMFRPISAIFRLLQFCSKSIIYKPILRNDAEISSSLRVTISLFSGKSNGQGLVGCKFYG